MPSSAAASKSDEQLDSAANLEFYCTRDDIFRAYVPQSPEEKLLVTEIAHAWHHLQQVHELRNQLTAQKGLLGLFNEDFEKYKFLMRNLTDAERMWRNAIQEFHRARRRNGNQRPPVTRPNSYGRTAVQGSSLVPAMSVLMPHQAVTARETAVSVHSAAQPTAERPPGSA